MALVTVVEGPASPTVPAAHAGPAVPTAQQVDRGPRGARLPSPVRRTLPVLRAALPVVLLAVLVTRLGATPFRRSLEVLTPAPIVAALLLGAVTMAAQALRWRTVAIGFDAADGLTRTRAVSECYRSALLNSVLPGGVLGDALRAWRQRPDPGPAVRGVRPQARAMVAGTRIVLTERVAGTALLLASVSAVIAPVTPWGAGAALLGSGVAALVALPGLRRLSTAGRAAVIGWSVLATASLVAKFAIAAAVLGTVDDPRRVVTLALVALAGMSVPLSVGGFGPREAVTALAFAASGLTADAGVTTSAAYGLLAAVSAVPGAAVMLLDRRRARPARP